MYLPKYFDNANAERTLSLMRAYPFATLISSDAEGQPFVSHLPLIVEQCDEGMFCVGHMARGNAHWTLLDGRVATAIFHGPHAYVTPRWYAENAVPTWNYAVVHARGQVRLIDDREGIVECLKKLHAVVERGPDAWAFWMPDRLADRLETAIVGFELRVESLQSKFKLSQNRSAIDRARVIEGLSARADEGSRAVSELMKEQATASAPAVPDPSSSAGRRSS